MSGGSLRLPFLLCMLDACLIVTIINKSALHALLLSCTLQNARHTALVLLQTMILCMLLITLEDLCEAMIVG